jgi:hypothetical protein
VNGASSSGQTGFQDRQLLAQSGRSLPTTDKNVAYRFAIKAVIGSKRATAGVVDQPPVRTVSGVSLRSRHARSPLPQILRD